MVLNVEKLYSTSRVQLLERMSFIRYYSFGKAWSSLNLNSAFMYPTSLINAHMHTRIYITGTELWGVSNDGKKRSRGEKRDICKKFPGVKIPREQLKKNGVTLITHTFVTTYR